MIEKYTGLKIASRRTYSRTYLPFIYEEKMKKLRESVGDNKIWVSIDETTDLIGRSIANVIIGILDFELKFFC